MFSTGELRLFLQEKGGRKLDELPWSDFSWGRVVDDMSQASATVPVARRSHRLASRLADINSWQHELAIHDGSEVWVGPVTTPQWTPRGVRLTARDVFQWFERRDLIFDRNFAGTDLADVFAQYAADALVQDPSPNIDISVSATGVRGDRTVKAADRRRAADEMREIARDALDFTVVRRSLLAGGPEVPTPALPMLTNDMVVQNEQSPSITGNGLLVATDATVLGSPTPPSIVPVHGHAGGVDDVTGLVQRTWNESSIHDNLSADAAARTRYAALRTMPLYIEADLAVRRCPPVSMLVPGARWPVDIWSGVKRAVGTWRLSSLRVTVRASDSRIDKTVHVTLIPLGSTEDDI